MFERFARDAKIVVNNAEARRASAGSATIEAEHLLLALTECDPATAVGRALAATGLDRDRVEQRAGPERSEPDGGRHLDRRLRPARAEPGEQAAPGGRCQGALEHALRISLVRADKRIESGHILLALLPRRGRTARAYCTEAGVDRRELNDVTTAAMDR